MVSETNTLRLLAREESERTILQHLSLCPFSNLKIEERVRTIETRFALLLGFMAGSGLLGGATGAIVVKILGG
jgi:hypothetical protein